MRVKESRLKDDRANYDRLQLSPPFCETWPFIGGSAPLVFPELSNRWISAGESRKGTGDRCIPRRFIFFKTTIGEIEMHVAVKRHSRNGIIAIIVYLVYEV